MFHSLFFSWINLLLVSSYLVNKGGAIRCYICGGEEDDSFSCAEFQTWDARYTKECDEKSKSCQISQGVNDKKVVSRSCERIQLDDCKIANSVEYCYCSKNLCNKVSPTDSKEDLEEAEDFPDDSMEGSGIKNVDHKAVTPELGISEKNSSTKQAPTDSEKAVKTNIIPSDKKYTSSSCRILQRNFFCMSILSVLHFLYIIQQY